MKRASFITVVHILLFVSGALLAQADVLAISITFPDESMLLERESVNHSIYMHLEDIQFQVIITNISDEPVQLWETWNSWGWYDLSFEILDDSFTILHTVEKKPRFWTRNFPSFFTLDAGEQYAIDVCFNETDWLLPLQEEEDPGRSEAYIRAVYTIPEDEETDEYGIWTGRIESKAERFVSGENY